MPRRNGINPTPRLSLRGHHGAQTEIGIAIMAYNLERHCQPGRSEKSHTGLRSHMK
jgi:hypothetical protein